MNKIISGLPLIVGGLLLAVVSRQIGDYVADSRDDESRWFGRWSSWLMYTQRQRRAARWWGVVAGAALVIAGLHVMFGILNFL